MAPVSAMTSSGITSRTTLLTDKATASLSTVRRAAQVLSALAQKGPLGIRALSRDLGLPVTSVQRILMDLAAESMAEQHDTEWTLGHRAMELGRIHLDRIDLAGIAKPYCQRIAAEVGEAVNIVVRNGLQGVCIDKTLGDRGRFQLDWPIGIPGPLYCGGAGKAILAFSSARAQEAVLSRPLTPLTPYTITDTAVLRAEIAQIRKRGYSIDAQEVAAGVWCVAVPILDGDGAAFAAMSISGPSLKEVADLVTPNVTLLTDACRAISRHFGYAEPWPGRQ